MFSKENVLVCLRKNGTDRKERTVLKMRFDRFEREKAKFSRQSRLRKERVLKQIQKTFFVVCLCLFGSSVFYGCFCEKVFGRNACFEEGRLSFEFVVHRDSYSAPF